VTDIEQNPWFKDGKTTNNKAVVVTTPGPPDKAGVTRQVPSGDKMHKMHWTLKLLRERRRGNGTMKIIWQDTGLFTELMLKAMSSSCCK